MISGLSGLHELVGAISRAKHGQPPSRTIQPMPKMDTVHFSVRSQEMSATGGSAALATQQPAAVAASPVTATPTQPADQMSLMDRMKASFFTSAGDAAFDASVDLNSDGKINHADLAVMRAQDSPDEMSLMDRMKASFFTSKGDDAFDASVDLNSDGKINHADLAALRAQENPLSPKEMLTQIQSSLFTRNGDEGFDAGVDLNTDGVINFADLAMLRARMETPVTRPPAEPITPVTQAAPAPMAAASAATEKPRFDTPSDTPPTIESIRSAFFSNAGDDSFNAAADLNGDGRVNFADLAALRGS